MILQLADRKEDINENLFKLLTVREVTCFIGTLISSFPGVEYGRLHYRHLECDKVNALKRCDGNFEAEINFTQGSLPKL